MGRVDPSKAAEGIRRIEEKTRSGTPPAGAPSRSVGMRVEVYRNIRDHSRWSVRSKETGKVMLSVSGRVRLVEARFVVRDSGRRLTVRSRVKNVHAWVEGDLVEWEPPPPPDDVSRVCYDPYRWKRFVRAGDGAELEGAAEVWFGLAGRVTARGLVLA